MTRSIKESQMPKNKINSTKKPSSYLVVSNTQEPTIKVQGGKKYDVKHVQLIGEAGLPPSKIGARLCGGTSTCLAIIEV
jgi:hypothetical protein